MADPPGRAPVAGYSGTPLARKLGVKPGSRVLLEGCPEGWQIPGLPPGASVARQAAAGGAAADVTIVFCRSRRDLERDAPAAAAALPAGGSLWIAWPRRAGGHSSDVTENLLREVLLPLGIVDVKVAALDHDWSGLKFVRRRPARR